MSSTAPTGPITFKESAELLSKVAGPDLWEFVDKADFHELKRACVVLAAYDGPQNVLVDRVLQIILFEFQWRQLDGHRKRKERREHDKEVEDFLIKSVANFSAGASIAAGGIAVWELIRAIFK